MTPSKKNFITLNTSRKNVTNNFATISPAKNKILCQGCAKCCLHVNHEIDPPETDEDCDYIIWFLLHENISIWVDDENVWYVEFKTPCKKLKDELCDIYKKRPQVCRDYPQDTCLNANLDDDISFETPEEFLDYLDKIKKYSYQGYYINNHISSRFWKRSTVVLILIIAILLIVWGRVMLR